MSKYTRHLLFLFSTVIFFHHCAQRQIELHTQFDLYGESKLTFSNYSHTPIKIKFEKWSNIPIEVVNVDTILYPDASFEVNLKNQSMDYVHLELNQKSLDIFMLPGSQDTLTFLENDSIVFSGGLSSINLFLFQKAKNGLSFNQLNHITATATHAEKDFMRFIEVNDSIHKVELIQLNANKSDLPDWYVEVETGRLKYKYVAGKLNSISFRNHMLKMQDNIAEDFFGDLVSSVELQNDKFIGESNYMLFLHEYANLKNRKKTSSETKDENLNKPVSLYMAQEIEGLFSGKVKDAFLAYRLGMLIKHSRTEYDTMVLRYFSDKAMGDFIRDYYYSSVILKTGVKMPYFFLENLKGEDVESNDYLGNILFINFWADWCKPCIQEFPHENALVEKYKGKPVKILNICIESKPEKWKEYTIKYGLKMENLYAGENWTKKLKNTYDISGIPHSVLIDWNGNIVENHTVTASRGIDKKIDALLLKMGKL